MKKLRQYFKDMTKWYEIDSKLSCPDVFKSPVDNSKTISFNEPGRPVVQHLSDFEVRLNELIFKIMKNNHLEIEFYLMNTKRVFLVLFERSFRVKKDIRFYYFGKRGNDTIQIYLRRYDVLYILCMAIHLCWVLELEGRTGPGTHPYDSLSVS